jgi:hypothetical protein
VNDLKRMRLRLMLIMIAAFGCSVTTLSGTLAAFAVNEAAASALSTTA